MDDIYFFLLIGIFMAKKNVFFYYKFVYTKLSVTDFYTIWRQTRSQMMTLHNVTCRQN